MLALAFFPYPFVYRYSHVIVLGNRHVQTVLA